MKRQLRALFLWCGIFQIFSGTIMISQSEASKAVLTQTEAELRARQIRQVDYQLSFSLPESEPDYSGKVQADLEITPEASQLSDSILMDFAGGTVRDVVLNGKPTEFKHVEKAKISVPSRNFHKGK